MEPADEARRVTLLLRQSRLGDGEASEQLISLVCGNLHRLTAQNLRMERAGHTLQATALVHEAWLRLAPADIEWQDRIHFYKLAARLIRRILVDYARAGSREKRGGGIPKISLDKAWAAAPCHIEKALTINDALDRLGSRNGCHRDILAHDLRWPDARGRRCAQPFSRRRPSRDETGQGVAASGIDPGPAAETERSSA